jgi:hypothetical protein
VEISFWCLFPLSIWEERDTGDEESNGVEKGWVGD